MRIILGMALVAVLMLVMVGAAVSQTTAVHHYESFGFSVALPSDCQPVSLGSVAPGAGLQEAFSSNGLAYIVIATSAGIPQGVTAHTAVNLAVQQINAAMSKVPGASAHLISATTASGEGVQGFGVAVSDSSRASMGKIPSEVKRMFGSSVYQAAVFVPVVDSPAVIAVIAVVGPSSREGEVAGKLMEVTRSFTIGKSGAGTGSSTASPGSRDSGLTLKRGPKSKTPIAPPQPDIKPISQLKKGQIELVGVVKSTDAAMKSLDMLVTQAVPFTGHGVMINPPRLKRVYVKEIAEGVKEGAVILVVAGDTGPGKSVTADTLTLMDMSKLGF